MDDRERVIEHPFADQVRVEPAGRGVGVVCGQARGEGRGRIEVDAPPSARPEQELEKRSRYRVLAAAAGCVSGSTRIRTGTPTRRPAPGRAAPARHRAWRPPGPGRHARPAPPAGSAGSSTGVTRGATSARPSLVFMSRRSIPQPGRRSKRRPDRVSPFSFGPRPSLWRMSPTACPRRLGSSPLVRGTPKCIDEIHRCGHALYIDGLSNPRKRAD